jgi:biotin---protein ligase
MISLKRDRIDFEAEPPKKILIYQDEGTCASSLKAIPTQLQRTLALPFTTKYVNSNYLKTKNWEVKTFALIMGGGHCSHWETTLGIIGMQKIHHFVAHGGRYLGICAGAYFAAATSIFHLAGQTQITKTRPIGFFQGTAIGPIIATDNHLSLQSALAVKIDLLSKKGRCYYQGGCVFDITEDTPTTKILARYHKPYQGSAIISCSVGQGKAVLTGLHPEFLWEESLASSKANKEFRALVEQLTPNETFRQDVWKVMIQALLEL